MPASMTEQKDALSFCGPGLLLPGLVKCSSKLGKWKHLVIMTVFRLRTKLTVRVFEGFDCFQNNRKEIISVDIARGTTIEINKLT
jgi:hypothetical protein